MAGGSHKFSFVTNTHLSRSTTSQRKKKGLRLKTSKQIKPKIVQSSSPVFVEEEHIQKKRTPIVLDEYMPNGWCVINTDNEDELPNTFEVHVTSIVSSSDDEALHFPQEEDNGGTEKLESHHMVLRGGRQLPEPQLSKKNTKMIRND